MGSPWFDKLIDQARIELLPIHPATRLALGSVLADELAPLRRIAEVVLGDPALASRVLQAANRADRRYIGREISTLDEAIHLLGTLRLSQLALEMPLDEESLDDQRLALYRGLCGQAWLAALLAQDWAEFDRDRVPAEVALAALLNHLGELYWLVHGDARIQRYLGLISHPAVLPHEAEYLTLGENLEWLGYRLATRWGLPEMVRESMRARNAQYPRPLYVMLANQIARFALSGWRCPGGLDDLHLTAELLGLEPVELGRRINAVLDVFNRSAHRYGLKPLSQLPSLATELEVTAPRSSCAPPFCLAPRADELRRVYERLASGGVEDPGELIRAWLEGLHRGLGLNRAVYALYDPRDLVLRPEQLIGTDFEPAFNRFCLRLAGGGLFARLMEKPRAIWLNKTNRAELSPQIPPAVKLLTGTESFFARSVWVGGVPAGLIYADRRSESCALDARAYQGFIELADLAETALARLMPKSRASGSAPAQAPGVQAGDGGGL